MQFVSRLRLASGASYKGFEKRVGRRLAALDGIEPRAEFVERRKSRAIGKARLVGDVVRQAREGVDRRNGSAQARGQQLRSWLNKSGEGRRPSASGSELWQALKKFDDRLFWKLWNGREKTKDRQ